MILSKSIDSSARTTDPFVPLLCAYYDLVGLKHMKDRDAFYGYEVAVALSKTLHQLNDLMGLVLAESQTTRRQEAVLERARRNQEEAAEVHRRRQEEVQAQGMHPGYGYMRFEGPAVQAIRIRVVDFR